MQKQCGVSGMVMEHFQAMVKLSGRSLDKSVLLCLNLKFLLRELAQHCQCDKTACSKLPTWHITVEQLCARTAAAVCAQWP